MSRILPAPTATHHAVGQPGRPKATTAFGSELVPVHRVGDYGRPVMGWEVVMTDRDDLRRRRQAKPEPRTLSGRGLVVLLVSFAILLAAWGPGSTSTRTNR